jgi:hypothetical protein
MSNELKYIDYDEALVVYRKTVVASGGGLQGIKDEGGIRKVLEFVKNGLGYAPDTTLRIQINGFRLQSAFGFL